MMNNITFTPPVSVSLQESKVLQDYLDSLGPTDGAASGGILQLPRGHFYGNLTVTWPYTHLRGMGEGTVIHGSILCTAGYCTFERMWIMGTGQQYGLRLSNTNPPSTVGLSGVPRCDLSRIRIGATAEGKGDGPVNGLELDGAIVTQARDQCNFSFCTNAGVFIDTTDTGVGGSHPWSTNVTRFAHCTANGNKNYGYLIQGGSLEGVEIIGGNIESNGDPANPGTSGAIKASGMNHLIIRNVDFEQDGNHNVTTLLDISTCNPVEVVRNNFTNTGTTSRVWVLSSCTGANTTYNRWSGFPANSSVGVIDENCFDCVDWPNVTPDSGTYLENRGRWS